MTYRAETHFDQRAPEQRDRMRPNESATLPDHQDWPEEDPGWSQETAKPPVRRRPLARRLLSIGIVLVVVLVVGAGGAYVADRMGWVDLAAIGLPKATTSGRTSSQGRVIFSGDASKLTAAPGNTIQEDPATNATWLRSRLKTASPMGATDGVSVKVPDKLVARIEGRVVRVTVSARTGSDVVPSPFAVAYSAGDRGNSGWFVFTPTAASDNYSFSYNVPIGEIEDADKSHQIGIWADIAGANAPLMVSKISIDPQ